MSLAPEPDDDRTVLRDPRDGLAGRRAQPGHALPPGTRVGGLEIVRLIGEGGFGIVYLAYDPNLDRQVALKEYMPSSLASRAGDDTTVVPRSGRALEAFQVGLRSFVNEARLLARFDHPALVKVYRFWEAHGTAYMVMPYYEGPTLKQALAAMPGPPDEATLRSWLRALMEALAAMHAEQCFHRDIAPDNILLTANGPLLLDFGAARRVVGDLSQALTAVLKPGYAPIEQYGNIPGMAQGPWTDIYSLGCVLYHAMTGRSPMPSVERLVADHLTPVGQQAADRYSASLLQAVDAALAVRPQDRPQSLDALRALLGEPAPAPAQVPELPPPAPSGARTQPAAQTRGPATTRPHTTAPLPSSDMPARRSALAPALLVLAFVTMVAAAGWATWSWRAQPATTAAEAPPAGERTEAPRAEAASTPAPTTAAPETAGPAPAAAADAQAAALTAPVAAPPAAATPPPAAATPSPVAGPPAASVPQPEPPVTTAAPAPVTPPPTPSASQADAPPTRPPESVVVSEPIVPVPPLPPAPETAATAPKAPAAPPPVAGSPADTLASPGAPAPVPAAQPAIQPAPAPELASVPPPAAAHSPERAVSAAAEPTEPDAPALNPSMPDARPDTAWRPARAADTPAPPPARPESPIPSSPAPATSAPAPAATAPRPPAAAPRSATPPPPPTPPAPTPPAPAARTAASPATQEAARPAARPNRAVAASASLRCTEILQKASLEPLTAEEAAYLRQEC